MPGTFNNYTERVDGFQICDVCYIGLPPKDTQPKYDVVKWAVADPPYEALDWNTGKRTTVTEYCYTVGTLEWGRGEQCFEFHSCGMRWLEAKPSEAVIDMVLDFAEKKGKELEKQDE